MAKRAIPARAKAAARRFRNGRQPSASGSAPAPQLAPVRRRVRRRTALLAAAATTLLIAALFVRGLNHPWFDHVYLIVLENREYGDIVGNAEAPFLNSLIKGYGLAANYDAVAHPSTPDYFTLLTGSTQDIRDDQVHDLAVKNLFDQLEEHGRTWHVYAQNYPGNCFIGEESPGGVDLVGAPGTYVRRHNPAISFTDISQDPRRCANITSLASFDPQAADFEMIVPNNSNNMHTGTIQQGDQFLQALVPRITANPSFANSVLFITWDEGTTGIGGGGQVATIVVRPGIKPRFVSHAAHTHRGLLRTIEEGWGLGCLPQSCQASDMGEFFGH